MYDVASRAAALVPEQARFLRQTCPVTQTRHRGLMDTITTMSDNAGALSTSSNGSNIL